MDIGLFRLDFQNQNMDIGHWRLDFQNGKQILDFQN